MVADKYTKYFHGHVRVWNEAGNSTEADNLIVYSGGDIVAQLLGGLIAYRLSVMYFAFENTTGTPSALVPSRADTNVTFRLLYTPQDFIRASITEPVQFAASGGDYTANIATFLAISNAAIGEGGVNFGAAYNSQVMNLALLAVPTGSINDDVLFSHFALPTPIPAAGSGQIFAAWSIQAD